VMGSYYCWPTWSDLIQKLDFKQVTVPAESSETESILQFTWPEDIGAGPILHFYGALFAPGTWDLIGDVQIVQFTYH
jgi:hypothetical protein